MATLTGLMNLARQSLNANEEALNVTANNVANQNTVGYTRQVASFSDGATISLSGGIVTNTGVSVTVQSQRDRVLEQRVQQQTQTSSAASARSNVLNELQTIVGITSSSTTAASSPIGDAIDSFFASLQTLSADPTNTSDRQAVLAAASTMASAFQQTSTSASQLTTQTNGSITTSVSQVNSLLKTVATLNGQIASLGTTQDAGTLEDQRQNALSQLSQLMSFNQTTTENGSIDLTSESGSLLVGGNTAQPISVNSTSGTPVITDAQGKTITGITGGSIGGNYTALGDIQSFQQSLSKVAQGIADAVNNQNEQGLTSNGPLGGAIFSYTAPNAASSLTVSATDPSAIATIGLGEMIGGTTNINALVALGSTNVVNGNTPAGAYASFLAQTGTAASSAANDATVKQSSLTQVTTQRDALSSVSLDEEASNLTQYQRAYEASAKIFSIVDDLMAAAINLGQPTTVS